MKKLVMFAMLVVASAEAQSTNTNTAPVTPSSTNSPTASNPSTTFLTSVEAYFTTFSTNNWDGSKGFLETSALYNKNINFGNEMELGVDIKDFSTNLVLYADASAINALGLGGVVASTLGLDVGYRVHDVQALIGFSGGYDYQTKSGVGSFNLELQKHLTENTFAYISFKPTYDNRAVKDYLGFGAGFTF